jgi:hypothetical protein
MSLDYLMGQILGYIATWKLGLQSAIPEKYPLLRTLQFGVNGMTRKPVVVTEKAV